MKKRARFFIFLSLCSMAFFEEAHAISGLIPGSAQPGLVKKNYLSAPIPSKPKTVGTVKPAEQKVVPLVPGAEKIKFKLVRIVLEGNHVYSNHQLAALYKDKLNKKISVLDLQNIIQDLSNFYRNNGYILSRAILPPQDITAGIVRVKIIEGYIAKVHVLGDPKGSKSLVEAYGNEIAAVRPTQVKVIERYLLLANAIPGAVVRAVFAPSQAETGASDLNLVVEQQTFDASFSYDNYGTLYLGPHQMTGQVAENSIFRPGDSTSFTYLTTTKGKQLRYGDLTYTTNLGSDGLLLTLDGNQSLTLPGFLLQDLSTRGESNTYTISLQYPIIRARDQNLSIDGNFAYLNSQSNQLSILLYFDHIRPAQIGGSYSFSDRWNGTNVLSAHLMHGFNIMGASNNPRSFFTSRFLADGIFTKWTAQVVRNQAFLDRFALLFLAVGQYAYEPTLVEEQFSFGGSQLGRGYDPAELLGDRGVAGSLELRMNTYPDFLKLQNLQFYLFYDAGVVWNIKNLPTSFVKQSATSTGLGARFGLTPYINGNVMFTQPLTKEVSAEELIGRGRCPRVFFSVTANI